MLCNGILPNKILQRDPESMHKWKWILQHKTRDDYSIETCRPWQPPWFLQPACHPANRQRDNQQDQPGASCNPASQLAQPGSTHTITYQPAYLPSSSRIYSHQPARSLIFHINYVSRYYHVIKYHGLEFKYLTIFCHFPTVRRRQGIWLSRSRNCTEENSQYNIKYNTA